MQQPNYIHTTEIHNTKAANEVLPFIFEKFSPKRVIDVGCGIGTWLSVAQKLGAEIKGIDGNYIDTNLLEISENEFLLHDLSTPYSPKAKYDLCICLEVVEHLPKSAAATIVETLISTSDFILFSAAIPNQGGQNHINEQWPAYWQRLFETENFYPVDLLRPMFWNNPHIEWWYKQNMLIYATNETIDRYKLKKIEIVNSYIHPELFNIKSNQYAQLENRVQEGSRKPELVKSIKDVIKAVIR